MFIQAIFGSNGQLYFLVTYTISWLLAAYITYIICIKNVRFKQGEAYFKPIEKTQDVVLLDILTLSSFLLASPVDFYIP